MRPSTGNHRQGFSLLEITLVLAILAVIAALALPRLVGSASSYRMRIAAQQVQAGWARARNQALKDGSPSLFVCSKSGQTFAVIGGSDNPTATAETLSSIESFLTMTADELDLTESPTNMGARLERLPVEITISAVHSMDAVPPPIANGESTGAAAVSSSISQIRFLPDGTSSDALIVLTNNREQSIGIMLRGITGTSSVMDIDSGSIAGVGQ